MEFLRIEDEPPQEAKPPPAVDFTARGISPLSLLCREVSRYLDRVDTVCLIHGAGLRRRNINLLDFRAER